MAVPKRIHVPGTYFVTSRTWESRKLFIKAAVCEIVTETMLFYRDQGHYSLHCFVLMPNHMHALLTPGPETTLERAVQLIKGGSARKISQKLDFRFPVWQRGYTDHRIRDTQDYRTHLRYIEENPVKVGLVPSAREYPWSSASGKFPTYEPQGFKPLNRGEVFGTVEQAAEKSLFRAEIHASTVRNLLKVRS